MSRSARFPTGASRRAGLLAIITLGVGPPTHCQSAPVAGAAGELDLTGAIRLAHQRSPDLAAAAYREQESEGALDSARVRLPSHPQLGLAAGPRRLGMAPWTETTDVEVSLGQQLELRGQRSKRVAAREQELLASSAAAEETARALDLEVASTFFRALAAREVDRLAEEAEALASSLLDLASRRLELGEGTALELNTARLRRAEAQRAVLEAQATSRSESIHLAQLLGLPQADPPRLRGELPEPAAPDLALEELVARARAERPDLRERARRLEEARWEAELVGAESWPGLDAQVSWAREEDSDIFLAGVTLPLPLAKRHRGERSSAEGRVRRIAAELDALRLAAEAEVRASYSDYELAGKALEQYDGEVVAAQQESLDLLERSFAAGEISYPDVLVVQREVLQARRSYLDQRLEYALRRARLLASANLPQTESGAAP